MQPDYESLFDRPVIILAAPRSGSTLLFETLSEAPAVWTVGGESHQFIEGLRTLNPSYGMVESNRLLAENTNERITSMLRKRFARMLRDRDGLKFTERRDTSPLRFLEKTPKNALRQPFLEQIFPGALYVYLYREPRANISSMMEAWRAGRWVTYPRLRGWNGMPWSLLLPPGWQKLDGRPLQEICAFQWATTNRIISEDLAKLPPERWMACHYEDLTADAERTARQICEFAGIDMDQHFLNHLRAPLPLSRYTHTAPKAEKWRKNEAEINTVLEQILDVQEHCERIVSDRLLF
jgi:hypothetical protein